jgi:hypothetical protein
MREPAWMNVDRPEGAAYNFFKALAKRDSRTTRTRHR